MNHARVGELLTLLLNVCYFELRQLPVYIYMYAEYVEHGQHVFDLMLNL